jgi:hypothetical protein
MLLVCAEEVPTGLARELPRYVSEEADRDAQVMGLALGFLPTPALPREERVQLAKLAAKVDPDAQVGLFSRLWRSAPDFSKGFEEWRAEQGIVAGPYWEALHNVAGLEGAKPEKWRKLWEEASKQRAGQNNPDAVSGQKWLIDSVAAHPDAPDAPWLIEQALKDPALSQHAVEVLWEMRGNAARIRLGPEARASLVKMAGGKVARMATGVLVLACNDAEAGKAYLEKVGAGKSEGFGGWPLSVDILLHLDPRDKRLDEIRKHMLEPNNAAAGGAWLAWLLDLRRGIAVGDPPVESLALALTEHRSLSWLPALKAAGERAWPCLDKLRDPYIFVVGSGRDTFPIMEYVGTLDYLERGKREAGKAAGDRTPRDR